MNKVFPLLILLSFIGKIFAQCPSEIAVGLPSLGYICSDNIVIKPRLSANAVAPFKVEWSSDGLDGYFDEASSQDILEVTTTFFSNKAQSGKIKVSIEDANGCKSTQMAHLLFIDSDSLADETVIKISEPLGLQTSQTRRSNLSPSANNNSVIYSFGEETDGLNYEFIAKEGDYGETITLQNDTLLSLDILPNEETVIQSTTGDLLFYHLDTSLYVQKVYYDDLYEYNHRFQEISLGHNIKPYEVSNVNGSILNIFWVNEKEELYTARYLHNFENGEYTTELYEGTYNQVTSSDSSKVIAFAHRIDNQLFFITDNGNVFVSHASKGYINTSIVGYLPAELLDKKIAQIGFLGYNDVFIVADNALYHHTSDTLSPSLFMEIVTPVALPSDAGKFQNKNILTSRNEDCFFIGIDSNVYELDWESPESFDIQKVTPSYINDQAVNDLHFSADDLIYQGKHSHIYVIHWLHTSGLPACNRQNELGLFNSKNSSSKGKIYPNPSSNTLTIDMEGIVEAGIVNIYDLQGQLMIAERYIGVKDIDISDLDKGVYLIKIGNDQETTSSIFQIIKQ